MTNITSPTELKHDEDVLKADGIVTATGIASKYWLELVSLQTGANNRLWLFVNNTWTFLTNTSDGLQESVQNAFNAGSNLEVEVWYDTLTPAATSEHEASASAFAPPNPFASLIVGLVVRSRPGAAISPLTTLPV
jgi:hypothetical protein